MGILGNYSVLRKNPGRYLSGADRANFSKSGELRNRHFATARFSAIPNGYTHPYTWSMAGVSGGLASYNQLSAEASSTKALLALGINIDASMSAALVESQANLALIVALIANLSANGNVSDANMAIILLLQSSLSATGSYTAAQLNNILGLISSLSASGTLSPTVTTLVNLSADIGGDTNPLSPNNLAQAVWNYLTSNPTIPDSMKELLENITSGSSDWTPTEKAQIRNRLGIDGTVATPTATPSLASAADTDEIKKNTNLIPAAI